MSSAEKVKTHPGRWLSSLLDSEPTPHSLSNDSVAISDSPLSDLTIVDPRPLHHRSAQTYIPGVARPTLTPPSRPNSSSQNSHHELRSDPSLTPSRSLVPEQKRSTPQPFSSPISDFSITGTSSALHSTSMYSPDIETALQKLFDPYRPIVPPAHLLPQVRHILKHAIINAIVSENYELGAQLESTAARLRPNCAPAIESSLPARIEGTRRELQAEHSQWTQALTEFRADQQRLRDEMRMRHIEEQLAYEEKWESPAAIMPYTKPSPELLRLRAVQKQLALARRFDEAMQVRREVEAMEAAEGKGGEERAMASVRAGFDALIERQKREMHCFDEHERRNVAYIEHEREKAVEPLVMLMRALENGPERKSDKQPVRREKKQPTLVVTPRARTRLRDFRVYDEPNKLKFDAQTIRKFVTRKRNKNL